MASFSIEDIFAAVIDPGRGECDSIVRTRPRLLRPADFSAESDPDHVAYKGLIFRAGDYRTQGFSMTPEELADYARTFEPVPIDLGHPHADSPLDGHFGELRSVELSGDGKALYGTVAFPKWLDAKLAGSARKVSGSWDRSTKRMRRLSLVVRPQIEDAELRAAFGAAHPDPQPTKFRSRLMTNWERFRKWMASESEGRPAPVDFSDPTEVEVVAPRPKAVPVPVPVPVPVFVPEATPMRDTPEFKAEVKAAVLKATRESAAADFAARAETWFAAELAAARVLPRDKARMVARFVRLAMDDRENPAEFDDGAPLSRLAEFTADVKARTPHGLTAEKVGNDPLPAGTRALSGGSEASVQAGPMTADRFAKLLGTTPEGRAALATMVKPA